MAAVSLARCENKMAAVVIWGLAVMEPIAGGSKGEDKGSHQMADEREVKSPEGKRFRLEIKNSWEKRVRPGRER
ncbi:Hypothetical predicted protein [Pelobates cultripes]|uniref:Uncharacterized protein n=1 Tax=Pelobates cultripes TaxID=61616 RepID=A0AAD1S225_PELCU|nr:Hypothetical predicted protein [Pelobates cultripes]